MPKKKSKFIIITGGVCSGLGKGIASASIGSILRHSGLKVISQKLDPYINVDPGTMSPFQHGEVFVLDDGSETDLDLGHYERFIDENLNELCSVTTGRIYNEVIERERTGDFLGGTIQIIPHITNAIKSKMLALAEKSEADVVLTEIGGTVGDIEGEPFLEAVRQLGQEVGKENVLYVHLVLLPYLKSSHEIKTKPAQASVRELRAKGIQPDIILARADEHIPDDALDKMSLFCNVKREAVIPAPTISSIYRVPLVYEQYNMSKLLSEKLNIPNLKPDLREWDKLNETFEHLSESITIGIAGKYVGLDDAYISVIEALKSAGFAHNISIDVVWLDSEEIEKNGTKELEKVDGIVVPGGFGTRGSEGKVIAAKYARENDVPYLGLCLGSQILSIEFARNVIGLKDANSTEFDEQTPHPVIHIMEDQKVIKKKGGTMRLGAYPCVIKKGTKAHEAYGKTEISERHRHRYEFNNEYRDQLEEHGLIISGTSPDGLLVEIVEVKDHPFMVASQFHPEFKSRPLKPHPLFKKFVQTIVTQSS